MAKSGKSISCARAVATNIQEARALIEVGFEYVTGEYIDGGKIFRKRKWKNTRYKFKTDLAKFL